MSEQAVEALRDLLALAEDANLDASVGDDKFAVIVRARQIVRDANPQPEVDSTLRGG